MIVVANRFKIEDGHTDDFVERFRENSHGVTERRGFRGFKLLTPDDADTHVAMTFWDSREDFEAWVESEAFERAHDSDAPDIFEDHPELEVHEVAFEREPSQEVGADG